jgi:hypothetical protein
MVTLPSVAAEMGARVWQREWQGELACVFSATGGRARVGQGRTREDTRAIRADANLGQGWIEPNTSVRLRRIAGARPNGPPVRSDQFGRAQTVCVSLLGKVGKSARRKRGGRHSPSA